MPFNACTIAVMPKAFYDVDAGCWIEVGTGGKTGLRLGRVFSVGMGRLMRGHASAVEVVVAF